MHERSLMAALLRQVVRLMEANQASRVTKVEVSVGAFSGVESELLRSAFEELRAATPASDAELVLVEVPLEGECLACGRSAPIERFCFLCPRCGGEVRVVRGEDLMLERITVEQVER